MTPTDDAPGRAAPSAAVSDARAGEDPRVLRAVQDYLDALEAGRPPDRREFVARHPDIAAALAGYLDALEFVQAAAPGLQSAETPAADPEAPPALPLGDFRIVREVGRGGMGIVYEAVQLSLGRRVALKVLPFAAALDPRQLQRFKTEAQAAAGLHHQHIVPVYAVGCERGLHYYAMQFIEGRTVADLVQELRRQAGRPGDGAGEPGPAVTAETTGRPGDGATERSVRSPAHFRSVARLGVQAAEALEHAHQLGVVHRDVKPANLLVDGRGSLWVTDFGLARLHGDAGLTLTGDLVGTLRYMSPEQALARPLLVDHRTDIYSLGASLYELLTLEPVYPGRERQELLQQIARDEPRPPRRLNPAVPAELETVLLKALEKDPAQRYGTAQELADDLGRFLRDEPVRARRPTPIQRLRKWARRHRAAVWTAGAFAAALLLLAVAGLALSNARVRLERDQKEQALEQAEGNLRLARKAVDEVYEEFADEFARRPQLQPLQRKFLLKALAFYREFAQRKGTDPEVRLGTGRAYHRAGHIQALLGQKRAAEEAFRRSVALLDGLAAEHPGEPRYRAELAGAYLLLGALGEPAAGGPYESASRRAVALWGRLAADSPKNPGYRHQLAASYCCLAVAAADRAEAEAAVRAGLPVATRLVADFPGQPQFRDVLVQLLTRLGTLQAAAGRTREAEQSFRDALARAGRCDPSGDSLAGSRALAYRGLALVLQATGRKREAADAYRQAAAGLEKLAADLPLLPNSWNKLSDCSPRLVRLLDEAGRPAEAARVHGRLLDLWARFLADLPDEADYHAAAAHMARKIATVLRDSGQRPEREPVYRRAADLAEGLAARFPARADYRMLAASWQDFLGSLCSATGRPREAAAAYRRAVAHYQAALEREPGHQTSLNNLAWLLATCPDGRFRDPGRAVALAGKAVGGARKSSPPDGRLPDFCNTLGVARYRAGDWAGAIPALEESVALFARKPEPETQEGFNAFFLAMAQWRRGDREAARRWYDRAVRWTDRNQPKDEELLRFRAEAEALLGAAARAPGKAPGS